MAVSASLGILRGSASGVLWAMSLASVPWGCALLRRCALACAVGCVVGAQICVSPICGAFPNVVAFAAWTEKNASIRTCTCLLAAWRLVDWCSVYAFLHIWGERCREFVPFARSLSIKATVLYFARMT